MLRKSLLFVFLLFVILGCSEEEEVVTINDNGVYSFKKGIKTGNTFEIKIDRDPARQ